tara:strand:+ start:1216 stop:2328 length:1113 start_codon:yes stop_codon:yes gene_type:complete
MKSKKIVFSSNVLWSIYNFRSRLLVELQKLNFQIHVLAEKDNYDNKLKKLGFIVHYIDVRNNTKNPFLDIILFFKYLLIYNRIGPDLILHNSVKPNIYGSLAAAILNIPTINNVSGLGTLFLNKGISTFIAKKLYKLSFKFSSLIFFQNQTDKFLFIKNKIVIKEKAKLIQGSGVDTKKFKNKKTPSDIFTFIYVGRFLRDKGLIELYDATCQLSKIRKDFKVIMLGDRYVKNESCITLKELNKFKNNSFFEILTHSDEVEKIMVKSDCLVLPSYREGLSKVLIEAGSCGLPSIATNVPGCFDVIEHGYNGFLTEPKNSNDLYEKMNLMLNLEKESINKLGFNARKKIENKFTIEKVNKIYISEIKNILK